MRLAKGIGLMAALARTAVELALAPRDFRAIQQAVSRRLVRVMKIELRVYGSPPPGGLIVCNHLSYLDTVVLSAAAPMVFVAKSEVRSWPIFGWFARRIGTIFVERGRVATADAAATAVARSLQAGDRVVLFPEGTSSGGEAVLPFKSSLLEPARQGPICAAAISYSLEAGDGDPAEDVCYWRDMTLLPHLIRLLGKRRIHAALVLAPQPVSTKDRKTLARELHAQICALKSIADRATRGSAASHVAGLARPERAKGAEAGGRGQRPRLHRRSTAESFTQ